MKNSILKSRLVLREFLFFIAVGIINTIVNYSVYLLLLHVFKVHYMASGCVGFMSGAVLGYHLNRKYAFKTKFTKWQMFFYFLVNFFSLGVNALVLYVVITCLGIWPTYAQLFGIAVTTLTNFSGCKLLVFNPRFVWSN